MSGCQLIVEIERNNGRIVSGCQQIVEIRKEQYGQEQNNRGIVSGCQLIVEIERNNGRIVSGCKQIRKEQYGDCVRLSADREDSKGSIVGLCQVVS